MPKPTIQFLSFGSSSETVDWCLDRPYKCPRLLGFILSFPITFLEQASLAELHLVNRNLKNSNQLTSNVQRKNHIPTQTNPKQPRSDSMTKQYLTGSLWACYTWLSRDEKGTFNSRQWNDGIAIWLKRRWRRLNMDVSKNRDTPKWMVYNGKPY